MAPDHNLTIYLDLQLLLNSNLILLLINVNINVNININSMLILNSTSLPLASKVKTGKPGFMSPLAVAVCLITWKTHQFEKISSSFCTN